MSIFTNLDSERFFLVRENARENLNESLTNVRFASMHRSTLSTVAEKRADKLFVECIKFNSSLIEIPVADETFLGGDALWPIHIVEAFPAFALVERGAEGCLQLREDSSEGASVLRVAVGSAGRLGVGLRVDLGVIAAAYYCGLSHAVDP